ncbi:MAG: RedB protein [Myxococcota bacterium]
MRTLKFERDSSEPTLVSGRVSFYAVLCAWAASVAGGVVWMMGYSFAPGRPATPPAEWPSSIARDVERPTLIVVAHPRCSCTRATLSELRRLLETSPPLSALVLFTRPEGAPENWERSSLWTLAEAIPGAVVLSDPGGALSSRFGAHTSGSALLYSRDGRLLFHGGLTSSRGHHGESPGHVRIAALLRGQQPERSTSDVFGCSLSDDDRAEFVAAGLRLGRKLGSER